MERNIGFGKRDEILEDSMTMKISKVVNVDV